MIISLIIHSLFIIVTFVMIFKMIKYEYPQYSYFRAFIFMMQDLMYEDFSIIIIGIFFIFIIPFIPLVNIIFFIYLVHIYTKNKQYVNRQHYVNYEYEYKKLLKTLIRQNKLTMEQINDLKISSDLMDELSKY